jgi:hypothetical protein
MLTGVAGAEASALLILVLRMNSDRFEVHRESSGQGTRIHQLTSGSSWSKNSKGAVEPPLNSSGSEPSVNWILEWIASVWGVTLVFWPPVSDLARSRAHNGEDRCRGWGRQCYWREPVWDYYCSNELLYRDSPLISLVHKSLIHIRNQSQHELPFYHSKNRT